MIPGLTPEVLAENRSWMQKSGALDANDVLFPILYREDTAPHHFDRQLHRQRQAAVAVSEMASKD
jgi:hypothetical protein